MKRIRIGIILLMVSVFCVCLMPLEAYAVHTAVGVPASRSYVSPGYKDRVIIFAGDSRTMYLTADNLKKYRKDCAFVFVNGGGVASIDNDGRLAPYLSRMIERYRSNCVVVMNFGINGNGNAKKNAKRITKVYRRWMKKYPDVQFLVESVNPTGFDSNTGYGKKKILKVNRLLKKEFSDIYIDANTYLLEKGIVDWTGKGTKDNIHYKQKTNRAIFKFVKKYISEFDFSKNGNAAGTAAG